MNQKQFETVAAAVCVLILGAYFAFRQRDRERRVTERSAELTRLETTSRERVETHTREVHYNVPHPQHQAQPDLLARQEALARQLLEMQQSQRQQLPPPPPQVVVVVVPEGGRAALPGQREPPRLRAEAVDAEVIDAPPPDGRKQLPWKRPS